MDDICSHLKISKKTLYQYFSNKDDLVEQIMMHRRNNYRTQKDIEELKQHNSVEIMLTIRDHIIRSFNSRMPANLFDLKKYHPDVYQRVNNKDQIFIQNLFNEVIDKGIRDGYFRSDINREIQVYLFVKQMSLIGEPEMISELKYPMKVSEKDAFFFCYAARLLSIFIFKTSLVFSIISFGKVILQK